MNEIMKMTNEEVIMTSLEVVELINNFRKEESNEVVKRHDDFMRSIRKELEVLENAGIEADRNFTVGSYMDKNNQERPCYKMNKAGIMQMLNKESALVRYKTQQYIEVLENKLKNKMQMTQSVSLANIDATALVTSIVNTTLQLMTDNNKEIEKRINEVEINAKNIITEQEIKHDKRINEITKLIGLKSKNVSTLTKLLKTRISDLKGYAIKADDYHYILAKERILRKFNVFKWEDIQIEKYNDIHAVIDGIECISQIIEIK